jgi:hypothetical protein
VPRLKGETGARRAPTWGTDKINKSAPVARDTWVERNESEAGTGDGRRVSKYQASGRGDYRLAPVRDLDLPLTRE